MKIWIMKCPNCGKDNEAPKQNIHIKCGIVTCRCNCGNCQHEFEDQQEYWQWLGLTEAPPAELER